MPRGRKNSPINKGVKTVSGRGRGRGRPAKRLAAAPQPAREAPPVSESQLEDNNRKIPEHRIKLPRGQLAASILSDWDTEPEDRCDSPGTRGSVSSDPSLIPPSPEVLREASLSRGLHRRSIKTSVGEGLPVSPVLCKEALLACQPPALSCLDKLLTPKAQAGKSSESCKNKSQEVCGQSLVAQGLRDVGQSSSQEVGHKSGVGRSGGDITSPGGQSKYSTAAPGAKTESFYHTNDWQRKRIHLQRATSTPQRHSFRELPNISSSNCLSRICSISSSNSEEEQTDSAPSKNKSDRNSKKTELISSSPIFSSRYRLLKDTRATVRALETRITPPEEANYEVEPSLNFYKISSIEGDKINQNITPKYRKRRICAAELTDSCTRPAGPPDITTGNILSRVLGSGGEDQMAPHKRHSRSQDPVTVIDLAEDTSGPSPPKRQCRTKSAEELVVYKSVSITTVDYASLEVGEFLNDNIIEFYLKYLAENMLPAEYRSRVHIFSSTFYQGITRKLKNNSSISSNTLLTKDEKRYALVEKWTKNIDLFEKDLVVFPICEYSHWFVILAVNPGQEKISHGSGKSDEDREPFLLLLDSMGTPQDIAVNIIRGYLACDWKAKRGTVKSFSNREVKLLKPDKPEQNNGFDCGVFLLQYMETILSNITSFLSHKFPSLHDLVSEDLVDKKREELARLIQVMAREQNPDEFLTFPDIRLTLGRRRSRRKRKEDGLSSSLLEAEPETTKPETPPRKSSSTQESSEEQKSPSLEGFREYLKQKMGLDSTEANNQSPSNHQKRLCHDSSQSTLPEAGDSTSQISRKSKKSKKKKRDKIHPLEDEKLETSSKIDNGLSLELSLDKTTGSGAKKRRKPSVVSATDTAGDTNDEQLQTPDDVLVVEVDKKHSQSSRGSFRKSPHKTPVPDVDVSIKPSSSRDTVVVDDGADDEEEPFPDFGSPKKSKSPKTYSRRKRNNRISSECVAVIDEDVFVDEHEHSSLVDNETRPKRQKQIRPTIEIIPVSEDSDFEQTQKKHKKSKKSKKDSKRHKEKHKLSKEVEEVLVSRKDGLLKPRARGIFESVASASSGNVSDFGLRGGNFDRVPSYSEDKIIEGEKISNSRKKRKDVKLHRHDESESGKEWCRLVEDESSSDSLWSLHD